MRRATFGIVAAIAALGGLVLRQTSRETSREQKEHLFVNEYSRFIEVDGYQVHYRDQGRGEETLVLVHGIGSSLHTWEAWVERLSAHYRIISLDLPGFGLTGPKPGMDYSQRAYSNFMANFLTALGIDSCHMAGNSLGGWITWGFAIHYPEMLEKIILIDAAGYMPQKLNSVVLNMARNPLLSKLSGVAKSRSIVRQTMREIYVDHSKVTNELVEHYYQLTLLKGNSKSFVKCLATNFWENTHLIYRVQAPTLILWGESDRWFGMDMAHRFKEDIPNAQLISYPGVGHVPMEEAPRISAEDALQFLQDKSNQEASKA